MEYYLKASGVMCMVSMGYDIQAVTMYPLPSEVSFSPEYPLLHS